MKSGKLWMTVFLIPIFALLQILVIYRYRAAVKEEAEIYERQLELYSANRQTVIEMTGRQSPAEIEKTLEENGIEMQDAETVEVIKIRRGGER